MILLRLFKNNRLGGVVTVFFLSLAIFAKSFFQPDALHAHSAMPLYNLLFGSIHTVPLLSRIVALMLLLILCVMLVRISFRFLLLEYRSYMPPVFFLVTAAAMPMAQQVTPALVGSIFYLLSFAMLFEAHERKPDSFIAFNASLVLALGSLFYLKLIWFIPLIWLSLATLRQVTFREILYPLVAYFLLFISLLAWYWGFHDNSRAYIRLLEKNLAFEGSFAVRHFSVYLYYGFILLLVLIASAYMARRFQSRKTMIQNIYQVMFYMFIAGILFFVFVARFSVSALVFIAFPVSYILSNYFHRRRNPWTHELAMWILAGLLVFQQLMA